MQAELNDRNRRILLAIINNYLSCGEPVGSRTVAKKFGFRVSPATVRNVMADLDELGLLSQPHTSAGRLPTDQGFRLYVDQLIRFERLSSDVRAQIRSQIEAAGPQPGSALQQAGRLLADLTGQAAMLMVTDSPRTEFRHCALLRIREGQILGILVDHNGVVHDRLLHVDFTATQDELNSAQHLLNERFTGLPLAEIRAQLADALVSNDDDTDALTRRALTLGQALINSRPDAEVRVVGEEHLFEQPEFAEVSTLKMVYRAFQEKTFLIRLLDAAVRSEGLRIFIGSECSYQDCAEVSVIATPISVGSDTLGSLGVIGPKRMNYPRIIPLVDYTARLLGELLGQS